MEAKKRRKRRKKRETDTAVLTKTGNYKSGVDGTVTDGPRTISVRAFRAVKAHQTPTRSKENVLAGKRSSLSARADSEAEVVPDSAKLATAGTEMPFREAPARRVQTKIGAKEVAHSRALALANPNSSARAPLSGGMTLAQFRTLNPVNRHVSTSSIATTTTTVDSFVSTVNSGETSKQTTDSSVSSVMEEEEEKAITRAVPNMEKRAKGRVKEVPTKEKPLYSAGEQILSASQLTLKENSYGKDLKAELKAEQSASHSLAEFIEAVTALVGQKYKVYVQNNFISPDWEQEFFHQPFLVFGFTIKNPTIELVESREDEFDTKIALKLVKLEWLGTKGEVVSKYVKMPISLEEVLATLVLIELQEMAQHIARVYETLYYVYLGCKSLSLLYSMSSQGKNS